ncbi:hypothetical protein ABIE00_000832 [Arthrobacter sp. OAP107]
MTAVYVSDFETKTGISAEQKAWDIAATVCDPEIPVLTIEDLGILRGVRLFDDGGTVARCAGHHHAHVLGLPGDGRHPRRPEGRLP